MSNLPVRGHAYEPPPNMPIDYAGPGACCGYGRHATHHTTAADSHLRDGEDVTQLMARINRARQLAEQGRNLHGADPDVVSSFSSILGALNGPAPRSAPKPQKIRRVA